jgi:hypothetical protein
MLSLSMVSPFRSCFRMACIANKSRIEDRRHPCLIDLEMVKSFYLLPFMTTQELAVAQVAWPKTLLPCSNRGVHHGRNMAYERSVGCGYVIGVLLTSFTLRIANSLRAVELLSLTARGGIRNTTCWLPDQACVLWQKTF